MRKIVAILLLIGLSLNLAACATAQTAETETSEPTVMTTAPTVPESPIDYLVLVNKTVSLPDGYEQAVCLETTTSGYGEQVQVERKAYEAYLALEADLAEIGVDIEIDSAYRSVDEQQALWDEWMIIYGEEYTRSHLAVPGYSEHHTGLAIDIFIIKNGERINDNDAMIAETEIFQRIHERIAMYGFILRYPEGRDDVTGYAYEPWHLRYINDPDLAQQIMDQGLTLEEYLGDA